VSAIAQTAPDRLVTTHLQMTDPTHFRPAFSDDHRAVIRRMDRPDVAFYRFLYGEVGREWRWRDRLLLSDDELLNLLAQPSTTVYVLYVDGAPAGYVELNKQGDETEIAYFGLRAAYQGSGYGKHLLSYGIAQAWAMP
jgi:ribosomal protein S18 acetylase RimI-like enzyme